ncbi:hypothetical protein A9993_23840 [Rahnella victoriana]|nr:hypothetical protein A9993_23840 [Rahnella victoriana]
MSDSACTSIGLLLFPALFVRAPNTKVHLIWKNLDLVVSDRGMAIQHRNRLRHLLKKGGRLL